MKTNEKWKTQDELDAEIPPDFDGTSSAEQAVPDPVGPEETTESAAQPPTPLISDHDTVGTTLKPIC